LEVRTAIADKFAQPPLSGFALLALRFASRPAPVSGALNPTKRTLGRPSSKSMTRTEIEVGTETDLLGVVTLIGKLRPS
jgi:hypothetical protein